MGFFAKLAKFFIPSPRAPRFQTYQVKCSTCGEVLEVRLDTFNDPSLDYEDGKEVYFCRKVLIGAGQCHQQVETIFRLDEDHRIISKQVSGGVFIE